jgi:group I intron endonuclease
LTKAGIYCIENTITGKKYIGQSANLQKRIYEHGRTLRNSIHENEHLQRAFNKYGESKFIFKILLYCEVDELSRYEQSLIDLYGSNTYNICKECVPTTRGIKYTHEQRKKLSQINSGKNNPMYGKKHSVGTRMQMSEKAKGEKNHNFGISFSEERKNKISQATSGEKNPRAKLIWEDVFWIREHRKEYTLKEIAEKFEVSTATIGNIISGKSWNGGANHSLWGIGQNGGME